MLLLVISGQPKRCKYQKADAGANRTSVVRPRRAQEVWIFVVTRWKTRDRSVRLERRPTATAVIENKLRRVGRECGMRLDTGQAFPLRGGAQCGCAGRAS